MRRLTLIFITALLLSSSATARASTWTIPCFDLTPAVEGDTYFSVLQNANAAPGWKISSTIPISITGLTAEVNVTVTIDISHTVLVSQTVFLPETTLYLPPHPISINDGTFRMTSPRPFVAYLCAPDALPPARYLPLIIRPAAPE